jgi:hypothetical protein
MTRDIRRRLYPCRLDMRDGTPEIMDSELLLLSSYQSRRRLLRNALRRYQNVGLKPTREIKA